MLKLQPDATWPQRLATQRQGFTAVLTDLRRHAAAVQSADVAGEARSTATHHRDLRQTLSKIMDMTLQADREVRRGDIGAARDTLAACYAIIGGELTLRLRVWRAGEPPTSPIAAELDAWITAIEQRGAAS